MRLAFPKPRKKNRRRTRWKTDRETGERHEFLYGKREHLLRRIEIFERCGGRAVEFYDDVIERRPAICGLCNPPHLTSWFIGHWIHLQKRHCDCNRPECTTFGCLAAHQRLHFDGRLGVPSHG